MYERSISQRVRLLVGEIIHLRQQADPAASPLAAFSRLDRQIIDLARDLNIHMVWYEYDGDLATAHCICGWTGEPSDDIIARSNEAIEHTMSPENFLGS
jgi:hypothetical protein